jgi:hypothetical protein
MLKYSSKKGFLKKISFVKENEESLEIFCFWNEIFKIN